MACLLIHGFTGGVFEVEYLKEYLSERGLPSYAISLKGHTGKRQDLRESTYMDWISSARDQSLEISKNYENVVLVGFSMGGLITLKIMDELATSKIVFVNCPIYLYDLKNLSSHIVRDVTKKNYSNLTRYKNASQIVSTKAIMNFLKILMLTKNEFSKIAIESLIIQCKDDEVVNSRSAEYIRKKIKDNVNIHYMETGGHRVFVGEEKNIACEKVYDFLKYK